MPYAISVSVNIFITIGTLCILPFARGVGQEVTLRTLAEIVGAMDVEFRCHSSFPFSLELLLTIRLQCKVPFVNGFEQSRNVMPTRKRFTDDEIREIRLSPQSARYLAQRYDVSHPTILNIRDRRTYKQVPDHLGADLKNKFVIHDAVEFLAELPDGYCGTAITAPPIREVRSVIGQRGGWTTVDERQAEQEYLELQRRIISECLRVVGPTASSSIITGMTYPADETST